MSELDNKAIAYQILQVWGDDLGDKLTDRVPKDHLELFQSIAWIVTRGGNADDGIYSLYFHEYGRMVDMGAGRAPAGVESIDDNGRKIGGRKPQKWYSKTTYGMIDNLIYRLSRGYLKETTEVIKNNIDNL